MRTQGSTKGRRARRGGLSLLELMIALSVIAISLMAIMSMIVHTTSDKEVQRELAFAKDTASWILENVKAQGFNKPTTFLSDVSGYLTATYGTPASVPPPPTTDSSNPLLSYYTTPVKGLIFTNPDGTFWTPSAPPGTAVNAGRATIRLDQTNSNLLSISVLVEWKGVRGSRMYTLKNLYSP
jgi:prepilin-type N-terminal cleavage/methylation domain-containing protein